MLLLLVGGSGSRFLHNLDSYSSTVNLSRFRWRLSGAAAADTQEVIIRWSSTNASPLPNRLELLALTPPTAGRYEWWRMGSWTERRRHLLKEEPVRTRTSRPKHASVS